MINNRLDTITGERRIAVTLGPGGVGKTTLAALLGLQASVLGRRTLVLTIDPAMRLMDALGLSGIPPGEHLTITKKELEALGVPAQADLTVAMLDTGTSLTELVHREVSRNELRKRILKHPFFRRLCEDLAGSREYAAMEEIHHLYLRGGFDFLVVDTAPTTHSLDFLQAPDRILDVLEYDSYRWLMRPALLAGKLGLKVLDFSGGYVVRTLSRFTGLAFLKELASFVDMFSGLMEGFRQRAADVKVILRSDVSSFVLVTTPDPNLAAESFFLQRRLASRDLAPECVVVNRVTPEPEPLPADPGWRDRLLADLMQSSGRPPSEVEASIQAMEQIHDDLTRMASRDLNRLDELQTTLGSRSALAPAPWLEEDIHDIRGLESLRRAVFEPGGTP